MKKITAFLLTVVMSMSVLGICSVAAADKWQDWTTRTNTVVKDGIAYVGNNGNFVRGYVLPDEYVIKTTFRVTTFGKGIPGFYVTYGGKRTGLYMYENAIYSFGGTYVSGLDIGNKWHDYRIYVSGDSASFYVDNVLVGSGGLNSFTASGCARFFTEDATMEVESFDIQTFAGGEIEPEILYPPLEEKYTPEFYTNWGESTEGWTITNCPEISVNRETGNLDINVDSKPRYFQVERAPYAPENFDFEFRLKIDDYGTQNIMFKAAAFGYNNYYYMSPDRLKTTDIEGAAGIQVDIGYDWHDWKLAVRGKYITVYMDGGEIITHEMTAAASQTPLLRLLVDSNDAPNEKYKMSLGQVHYKPYFSTVDLMTPPNGAEFVEGSDVTFRATPSANPESVVYCVNGVEIGKGYAPDYEYVLKNVKVGTYRVSAMTEDGTSVESLIHVKPGFDGRVVCENSSVRYGEKAIVKLQEKALNEKVMPVKVEYFVDGIKKAESKDSPFYAELDGLEVGCNSVYAQITNNNGMQKTVGECKIDVYSDVEGNVSLKREYEVNYNFDGEQGEVKVFDGYFGLEMNHQKNVLTYADAEGTQSYNLGNGRYRIIVTAGNAEVYYNGQFAFSFLMPRTDVKNITEKSGVSEFVIGGRDNKTRFFAENWKNEANYSRFINDVGTQYSFEFDKTDSSDEVVAIYDGQHEVKLEIKDGRIHTLFKKIDGQRGEPFTLAGEAKPGYYRITVAKGLAQLFIDNVFVDSFAAPTQIGAPRIMRKMSNPSASTVIEVKGTDDKFYHSDDFSGKTEFASEEYWIQNSKEVSAQFTNDKSGSYMKLTGTGEYLLNGQSDDVHIKWSAKTDDTQNFYIATRLFKSWYDLKIGYDYVKGCWYTAAKSTFRDFKTDERKEYQGTPPKQGEWHDFELVLEGKSVVLKCDGETVIYTDEMNFDLNGYTAFGITSGSVCIDNLEYEGRCKVSPGIKSVLDSSDVGICEFFETSDGRVITTNKWTGYRYTSDKGETWSTIQPLKKFGGNIIRLQDGRLFQADYDSANRYIYAYVSTDDGDTWTQTGCVAERFAERREMLNGSIMQAKNGRVYVVCDEAYTEIKSITGIYYSDDLVNWTETSKTFRTEETGYNIQEGGITELPDGTIRYNGRTGLGFIYYNDSKDGGMTFGEFRPTQFIAPLCSYAFERDPEDDNTYYAIFTYDATTYGYRYLQYPRNRFALAVSYDGMKTWQYAMTLNEHGEMPSYEACNHSIRIFGDTIYVSWNNLNSPRKTMVYSIDKTKLKPLKRFEEVHARFPESTRIGDEMLRMQCIVPKSSGDAVIFGEKTYVKVKDGMCSPDCISAVFGYDYAVDNNSVVFTMGNANVVFSEASSEYTVNGVKKAFDEICMKDGLLNIKACAEAFGKKLEISETAYIIWYNEPAINQYKKGIGDFAADSDAENPFASDISSGTPDGDRYVVYSQDYESEKTLFGSHSADSFGSAVKVETDDGNYMHVKMAYDNGVATNEAYW